MPHVLLKLRLRRCDDRERERERERERGDQSGARGLSLVESVGCMAREVAGRQSCIRIAAVQSTGKHARASFKCGRQRVLEK